MISAGMYAPIGTRAISQPPAAEAAVISKAIGKPVRLQGMRHEGTGWDPKPTPSVHTARAALDKDGNIIAYDAANGKILWHSRVGQVSNAPETYMLDGRQYLLVAAGDTLFAFTLY